MKALLVLVAILAGCAKPAGGPLASTFDGTKLASINLDAKQAVAQAQQQYELAVQQHDRAEEAYRDSEIEQEVADYQAERSVLVAQLVGTKLNDKAKASAEATALARKTADAKVEFMRARRLWLQSLTSSTYYGVYATQAKLELERAKLAQANGLTPAGFDVATFEHQLDQRDRAASSAAADTEKERQVAGAKLTAWNELEKGFIQVSGMKVPSESDRAIIDWKQTAATAAAAAPAGDQAASSAPAKP